ncbi:hypothetical protein [Streptomyces sp. NPDC058486]|uniref:hypothetical protein n=1 Tax=unclassified Streptomyces TaxID=2593676 RepID=UPI0036690010
MDGDGQQGGKAALAELRRRLGSALATRRWTKTQVARQAALGRTTVSEAFRDGGPVPSEQTVAALAGVLHLDVDEMLGLRRSAAATVADSGADAAGAGVDAPGPGRPIREWEPHALEVHPAGPVTPAVPDAGSPGTAPGRALAGYVRREHDRVLAAAVNDAAAGRSRMLVLVGSSSTGKTRACWEAVQPLAAEGWHLWHPFDPTRAEAALDDLCRVGPRTVVWLNEAQHYLGDRAHGERIAAALHHLLVTPERGPVLLLGTLWPEYAHRYTALPVPGGPDPYSRVRELLSGRTSPLPEFFDAEALAAAATLAKRGDELLADALTRAGADGRVTQDLAGAPALLDRLRHATPAARALLEAAMDARRLGVGLHLPRAFLTDAAIDYLTDTEYDHLTDDWAERAFAELTEPVHGKHSPLRRTTLRPARRPSTARTEPEPGSGSGSGHGPGPVLRLADYLEQHGRATRRHLCPPASFWHAAHLHLTHADDLHNLAEAAEKRHRLQWAHQLNRRAADFRKRDSALAPARQSREASIRYGSEAEALVRGTAGLGRDGPTLFGLAVEREEAGDRAGAEALYGQAADLGDTQALSHLARIREEAGDQEAAEALALRAARGGDRFVLSRLAVIREMAGDQEGAEALYWHAALHGDSIALSYLAQRREEAGDPEGVESLYQQAAYRNDSFALSHLARMREETGDQEAAEALALRAARLDDNFAVHDLARRRKEAGDRDRAESLYRQAADLGDTQALSRLAAMREETGDLRGAEALYREAADRGGSRVNRPIFEKLWPHGLDPDGTPTPRWESS